MLCFWLAENIRSSTFIFTVWYLTSHVSPQVGCECCPREEILSTPEMPTWRITWAIWETAMSRIRLVLSSAEQLPRYNKSDFQTTRWDRNEDDMETNMRTTSLYRLELINLSLTEDFSRSYGFWISALNKADNYKRGKRAGKPSVQFPYFQNWVWYLKCKSYRILVPFVPAMSPVEQEHSPFQGEGEECGFTSKNQF